MRKTIVCLCLTIVLGSFLEAQRPTRQRSRTTTTTNTNRSGSWTRSRTTPNRTPANTVPSVNRSSLNVGRDAGWGNRSRVDPYSQMVSRIHDLTGYRLNPWDLYYCDLFYSRLRSDFGFRFGRDAFWSYTQGGPVVTPDAGALALQTSSLAADRILNATSTLTDVLDEYEAGSISEKEMEERSNELLKDIKRETKRVRNDFYIEYLDQRQGLDVQKVDPVQSLPALRSLIAELRDKALDLKQDFDLYFKESRTTVVSVEELTAPSFKSRSKEIDKLASAIKKSVNKL